jgi:hypothetical protein
MAKKKSTSVTYDMTLNQTKDLNYKYPDANAAQDSSVVYTTANSSIATVNASGVVTAKAVGTTTVTISTPGPNPLIIGTAIIKVTAPVVAPSATVTAKAATVTTGAATSVAKLARSAVLISPTNLTLAGTPGSAGVYTVSNSSVKLFGEGTAAANGAHAMFNTNADYFRSADSAFFEKATFSPKKRFYVGIDFGSAKVIYKIRITCSGSQEIANMAPTSFYLEGSNDTTNGKDGTWVDLQVAGSLGTYGKVWKPNETREFLTRGPNSLKTFKAIRLHSPDKMAITKLEVFSNQMTVLSPEIDANGTGVTEPSSGTFTHTSSGLIMSGPYLGANFPWLAFASNAALPFIADSANAFNQALPNSWKSSLTFMPPLGLNKQMVAKVISIKSGSTAAAIPKYFTLQGFTSSGTWESIYAGGNSSWQVNTLMTFPIEKSTKYGAFRIVSSVQNMEIAFLQISGFDDTLVSGL